MADPLTAKPKTKKKDSLTHKTLLGFVWNGLGTVGIIILNFLVLAVTSRLLTPAENGYVQIATTLITFASIFYQLGLGPSIVQRKELTESHIRSAHYFSLITGALVTLIIWLIAPFVVSHFFKKMPELTGIVQALAFLPFVNSVGLVARSINHRNLNFKVKSGFNLGSYTIGYGVVGITLAFLGYGAWALVWASLVQSFFLSLFFLIASPHSWRFDLNFGSIKDLLGFGTGFTIVQVLNSIALNSDNLIVGSTMGPKSAGLYGRTYTLLTLPAYYFGSILDKVLFTAIAKIQDEPLRMQKVFRRGVSAISLVVLPLSVFFFFFAPEVILFLLGKQWLSVVPAFRIFTLSMLFRTSYKIANSLCRSSGAVFSEAKRQAIYAFLVALSAWIGHFWGIEGVAVGVSLAITFNFFAMMQLSLRITHMSWAELWKVHVPALNLGAAVALECALLSLWLHTLHLKAFVTIVIVLAIILPTVFLLWRLYPARFLGREGLWMADTVTGYIPQNIRSRVMPLLPSSSR